MSLSSNKFMLATPFSSMWMMYTVHNDLYTLNELWMKIHKF